MQCKAVPLAIFAAFLGPHQKSLGGMARSPAACPWATSVGDVYAFRDGETIFNAGDLGFEAFTVLEGAVAVLVGEHRALLREVACLGKGKAFGELAAADPQSRRTATCVARGTLTRLQVSAVSERLPDPFRRGRSTARSPPPLPPPRAPSGVASASSNMLKPSPAPMGDEVRFADGDLIVRQGDKANAWFVLKAGVIDVTVSARRVASMVPGEIFGESAVLDPAKQRTASCVARGTVCVLRMRVRNDLSPTMTPGVTQLLQRRRDEIRARTSSEQSTVRRASFRTVVQGRVGHALAAFTTCIPKTCLGMLHHSSTMALSSRVVLEVLSAQTVPRSASACDHHQRLPTGRVGHALGARTRIVPKPLGVLRFPTVTLPPAALELVSTRPSRRLAPHRIEDAHAALHRFFAKHHLQRQHDQPHSDAVVESTPADTREKAKPLPRRSLSLGLSCWSAAEKAIAEDCWRRWQSALLRNKPASHHAQTIRVPDDTESQQTQGNKLRIVIKGTEMHGMSDGTRRRFLAEGREMFLASRCARFVKEDGRVKRRPKKKKAGKAANRVHRRLSNDAKF